MVTWVKVIHSASSQLGSMQKKITTFLARLAQANSLALYKYFSHQWNNISFLSLVSNPRDS